ncbi:cysteine-rich secretory protein family domain-containing protein [Ditylenchus destructor]|nr:cysteine-rich secretory protein family domain-containing protein [Ditylenchus destructor]
MVARYIVICALVAFSAICAKGQAKNPDGTTLPTGSSIYGLKYNTQLETTIQTYVNKCIVKHSPPEERYGNNTGENLFYWNSLINNTYALQSAMKWWWGELADFGFYTPNQVLTAENLKCNPNCNGTIGHFTNMAWETTREVGCGVTQCKDQGITLVACNYSPGGNWVGKRVYVSGPRCTATSGCTNTPASTCYVSSGLCFVNGVGSTVAPPATSSTKPSTTTTKPTTKGSTKPPTVSSTVAPPKTSTKPPTSAPNPLTAAERQVVTSVHNNYRSTLAKGQLKNPDGTFLPSGSSIYGLKYNESIEAMAQKHVAKCVVEHMTYEARNGFGSNLFYSNALINNTYALQNLMSFFWSSQAKNGFYNTNQVFTEADWSTVGGWSYMAWETTREIGCGVAQCPDQGKTLVNCLYSPSGNTAGKRVYVSGPPCTASSGCTNIPASTCDVPSALCFVGGVPSTTTPNPLTAAERQVVTSVHNNYRSTLAKGQLKNPDGTFLPSGSSIYGLKYNDSIEAMAQKHVAKKRSRGMTYEARNGFGSNLFYSNALINNSKCFSSVTFARQAFTLKPVHKI